MTDDRIPDHEINLSIKPRKLGADQPGDIPDFAKDQHDPFVLSIDDIVLIGIRRQTSKTPDTEIGGFLLGRHFSNEKTVVVHITGFLPVQSDSSSAVHFNFTHTALLQMRAQLNKSQDYIVGWYHSHVGSVKAFMSAHDINLHKNYFNQSWYVSCVVSGGEQGLPVGLWRISEDQVLEIDQHFVKMTKAISYQEQSQRFLSPIKTISPPSFSLTFLTDLGYEQKHPFYQALLELQQTQNEVNPANAISFELFKKILETTLRIGSIAALRSELESFIKKIELLRSLDNAVSVVFYSAFILNHITVRGDFAYSISIGIQKLVVCDFIINRYINIDLPQQISPLDIEIKDNTIWVLASSAKDRFVLLKLAIPATGFQQNQNSHFSFQVFALDVSSPPKKLLSFENNLWLHCANGVYGIEKELLNEKNMIAPLSPANIPSKAFENCVWVKGGNGIFISNNSGELKTMLSDGIVKERVSLPKRFEDAKVIDACNSVDGIYIILASQDKRTLILVDKKTLEIKCQYLSSKLDSKDNLHSFAIDANRIFLQLGEYIVLLTDTGSLSPLWFHSISKKNTGSVYLITQENFDDKWK